MRTLMLVMALSRQPIEIACNDGVLTHFWTLLAKARYGQSTREHAAFVVFDEGSYSFVAWPYGASEYAARYKGSIPEHTVAIIHTHPNAYPMPSAEDETVAQKTGIPIYVLTRTMISRTGPLRVWNGDWKPGRRPSDARSNCGKVLQ